MKTFIDFDAVELPDHLRATRERVREFLQREYLPKKSELGSAFSPEFSRLCGEAGYIGMTWPKQYGGGEKSFLERYIVHFIIPCPLKVTYFIDHNLNLNTRST